MNSDKSKNGKKEYLGIHFHCCNVYSRIYKNKQNTAYEGRCPICRKPIVVQIGKDGVPNRFFDAY